MDNNACLGACAEDGAVWGDGSGRWPRGARSDASAPLAIGSSSRSALQEAFGLPWIATTKAQAWLRVL
ncbi:hypothetical protein XcmpCFBP7700_16455 [Xanthomonas campestris]|nr:hypothetical protein XcmpCFBP7700_16455 [Xanthomonas campestris]